MDRVFLVHEFSKRANPWLATLILCLGLGRLNGIFARCVHCFYQDAVRFSGRSWLWWTTGGHLPHMVKGLVVWGNQEVEKVLPKWFAKSIETWDPETLIRNEFNLGWFLEWFFLDQLTLNDQKRCRAWVIMSPFAEASARGFAAQPSQPPLVEEELMTQVTGTFLEFSEMGLLDFSAPVSWIGVDGNGWKVYGPFLVPNWHCLLRMRFLWKAANWHMVWWSWSCCESTVRLLTHLSGDKYGHVWSYDTENDDLIKFQIGYL